MKPIDYSKTVMYKIVCKDLTINEFYVGHTTNFTQRKSAHKTVCNNEKSKDHNIPKYQIIRNNGGWDNWEMIEIEKFPCQDGNEARARERYWIELLQPNLNIRIPARIGKEYYATNKEQILQSRKQYKENNLEKVTEYYKTYSKQYYEKNKERIRKRHKEYYDKIKNLN